MKYFSSFVHIGILYAAMMEAVWYIKTQTVGTLVTKVLGFAERFRIDLNVIIFPLSLLDWRINSLWVLRQEPAENVAGYFPADLLDCVQ